MRVQVTVTLFSVLRKDRFEKAEIQVQDGTDVRGLLDRLGILPDEVGIVVINESDAAFTRVLRAGDRVTLIPPLGGG